MVKEFYITIQGWSGRKGSGTIQQTKGEAEKLGGGGLQLEGSWVSRATAHLKCNRFVTENYSWGDSILTPLP